MRSALAEQRVEEVGALAGGELDLLRDAHADHARAQRVPGGLALGDVERVREGPDDPGERNVLHSPVIGTPEQNPLLDAA
jgi:hypothetical protein